jgi:predicted MFS family arabinose efflux permease
MHNPLIKRDHLTRITYAQIGAISWFIFGVGPAFALLRDDFGVSRTVIAFHNVLGAIGSILAGLTSTYLIRRFGRGNLLRISSFGLAIGTLLFISGNSVDLTLPGIFLCGYFYIQLVQSNAAFLNHHHGVNAPSVVSEANAIGALIGFFAPITLGIGIAIGFGWRAGLGIVIVALIYIEIWRGKNTGAFGSSKKVENSIDHDASGRLPLIFWPAWLAMAGTAATEASIMTWGSELLTTQSGLTKATATGAIGTIVLGMGIGRLLGSRIMSAKNVEILYRQSLMCAIVAFFIFWQGRNQILQLSALAVMGLVMSLHFPLGITRMMRASNGRVDKAVAMSSVGAGAAAGFFPFLVGATADASGVVVAFTIPVAALGVALIASLAFPVPLETANAK